MTEQSTLIRYVGTREAAHLAVTEGYEQAKTLIALGRRVKVTVEEAEDELTVRQRAFLHAAVFPQIAEQYTFPDGTRYVWQVWKEFWRARFLPDRYVMKAVPRWDAKQGRIVVPKKKTPHRERVSTQDLSCKQYSAYIDRVIDTAVLELGVVFRFRAGEREGVKYVAPVRKAKAIEREAQPA